MKLPRHSVLLYSIFVMLMAGCVSEPSSKPQPPQEVIQVLPEEPVVEMSPVEPEPEPAPVEEPSMDVPKPPPIEKFDPTSITREVYDSTKSDVQALIEELNRIIRKKDYDGWVAYLGQEYEESLSDEDFLGRISESTILKKQKIVLHDIHDYFIYVVVPSRANDHVDDIEFIGQNRVKAFTINPKGQRLRLYDLEKTERGWKIVN